jgi:3-hydroxyacyl-CoA dehydrogenase
MGRLGQKTGAGFYRYDKQTRKRHEDPEVLDLIRAESGRLGITPRSVSDEEIVERLVYPLINEGANILQEGIARQAGDIDIVYIYGYGFPAWRGGPMFYARTVGFEYIYNRICEFRDGLNRPEDWRPSKYLESLIKNS